MSFIRKLSQDIKAGHLGALYVVLDLVAIIIAAVFVIGCLIG